MTSSNRSVFELSLSDAGTLDPVMSQKNHCASSDTWLQHAVGSERFQDPDPCRLMHAALKSRRACAGLVLSLHRDLGRQVQSHWHYCCRDAALGHHDCSNWPVNNPSTGATSGSQWHYRHCKVDMPLTYTAPMLGSESSPLPSLPHCSAPWC